MMRLRAFGTVMLVLAFSGTLTACHDIYCGFIEGLTGEAVDCSHDSFPDVGDIPIPSLPPPPPLPTTTTPPASTTSSTTSSTTTTISSTTTTEPSSPTTTMPPSVTTTTTTTLGASSIDSSPGSQKAAETVRAAKERARQALAGAGLDRSTSVP